MCEGTKFMFLRDLDKDGRFVTAKKAGVGNLAICSTTQGENRLGHAHDTVVENVCDNKQTRHDILVDYW